MTNIFEGMDYKNVYLRKGTEIIGLHAIGDNNSEWIVIGLDGSETFHRGFRAYESWGNEYNEDLQMIGKGSFRVFNDIDIVAEEFVSEGWEYFNPHGSGAV